MLRAQSSHPLDPLSAAEIAVAVATVRAAGATPEVCHFNPISEFFFAVYGEVFKWNGLILFSSQR